MATLSFSCPKCNKLHERIKPEMVGHKVRCQCGFVFRLGSKSDKQAWVVEELNRKKAAKQEQADKSRTAKSPAPPEKRSLFDEPIQGNPVFESPLEEILDAVPISAEMEPLSPPETDLSEPVAYEPEPFAMEDLPAISAEPIAHEIPAGQADPFADLNPAMPLAPIRSPSPPRTPSRRRKKLRGKTLASPAGPVWNLVLTLIGVPVMMVLLVIFARHAFQAYRMFSLMNQAGIGGAFPGGPPAFTGIAAMSGGATATFFICLIMFLLMLALTVSMIGNAIVSVIELANGIAIQWASKTTAIIALVVVVGLLMMFAWQVFSFFSLINQMEALGRQVGRELDKSKIGTGLFWLAFRFTLYGIIPLAVAITGFFRTMKR